jgi:hypothetical protein
MQTAIVNKGRLTGAGGAELEESVSIAKGEVEVIVGTLERTTTADRKMATEAMHRGGPGKAKVADQNHGKALRPNPVRHADCAGTAIGKS